MLTCSVEITLHHRLFATAARDKNKQGIIRMNKLCMHRKHYKHRKFISIITHVRIRTYACYINDGISYKVPVNS